MIGRRKITASMKQNAAASKAILRAVATTSTNLSLGKLRGEKQAEEDLKERIKEIQRKFGYGKCLSVMPGILVTIIEKPFINIRDEKSGNRKVKLFYKPIEDYLNEHIQAFQRDNSSIDQQQP